MAGQRRTVVAIEPETGETLWMWRMPENPRWQASTRKNYGKGLAYARVDDKDVLYLITPGYYMVALDPDTGTPISSFGINGVVDLHLGWVITLLKRTLACCVWRHHQLLSAHRRE